MLTNNYDMDKIVSATGSNGRDNVADKLSVATRAVCGHANAHKETSSCIFCLKDQDKIVLENALAKAFFDEFPVSPGHVLIIPIRHVASYFDLTKDEILAMQDLLFKVKALLDEKYHPDGYNIGINVGHDAGQSVFHVHMHLIPRYRGDVKNPKGGVRGVIPAKQSY